MGWGALLGGSIFVCATAATAQQLHEDVVSRDPLLIFVAEGPPNSCGPNCNRWIAVEGRFDRGSAKRFRDFLDQDTNSRLPIYFHSMGGYSADALEIGRLLRGFRMTAGIGRTSLLHCAGHATSRDCRNVIRTTSERRAHLKSNEGVCASACVYAFIGASRRAIDPAARIAVHGSRTIQLDKGPGFASNPVQLAAAQRAAHDAFRDEKLRYTAEMGVDPALVEFAYKVDPSTLRYLSRGELDRFGVTSKPHFETPWSVRDETPNAYTVFKAMSRWRPPTDEQLTTTVGVTCYARYPPDRVALFIRRERGSNESGHEPLIRIKAEETEIWASSDKDSAGASVDLRAELVAFDTILKALPKRSLEYSETFDGEWADRSNSIKLSIEGMEAALMTMRRHCERIHGTATQPARLDR